MELFARDNDTLSKVLRHYKVTEKSLQEDVRTLQEWIKTQHHLPTELDSTPLQHFLIINKFSVEKTKNAIDSYYSIRSKLDDIYEKVNPKLQNMKSVMDIIYMNVHYKLYKDIERVCFFKFQNVDLIHQLDLVDVLRIAINIQELRLRQDLTCGGTFIIDCQGVDTSIVFRVTPTFIFKGVTLFEQVFSSQLNGLYFINFPPICHKALLILKRFMKPKLFERIHICENVADLRKQFPVDFLPKDFGGTGPSLEKLQNLLLDEFEKHQDLFDRLDAIQIDESLRPQKIQNDDMLGFQGNFKKLDFD